MSFDPKAYPVRFSNLKHIDNSPAHYLHALRNRTDTPVMRRGRLVHAMLLGGIQEWVGFDGDKRSGKEWKAFDEANQGAEVYTNPEWELAEKIADAVRAEPDAMAVLQGEREKELAFKLADRACGARLDVLGPDYATDLKVVSNGHPKAFRYMVKKMAYHAQVAWYMNAAEIVTKRPMKYGYLVQVEAKPPFCVSPLRLKASSIELGHRIWRTWYETLRNCEESNDWPGYVRGMTDFDVEDEWDIGEGVELA